MNNTNQIYSSVTFKREYNRIFNMKLMTNNERYFINIWIIILDENVYNTNQFKFLFGQYPQIELVNDDAQLYQPLFKVQSRSKGVNWRLLTHKNVWLINQNGEIYLKSKLTLKTCYPRCIWELQLTGIHVVDGQPIKVKHCIVIYLRIRQNNAPAFIKEDFVMKNKWSNRLVKMGKIVAIDYDAGVAGRIRYRLLRDKEQYNGRFRIDIDALDGSVRVTTIDTSLYVNWTGIVQAKDGMNSTTEANLTLLILPKNTKVSCKYTLPSYYTVHLTQIYTLPSLLWSHPYNQSVQIMFSSQPSYFQLSNTQRSINLMKWDISASVYEMLIIRDLFTLNIIKLNVFYNKTISKLSIDKIPAQIQTVVSNSNENRGFLAQLISNPQECFQYCSLDPIDSPIYIDLCTTIIIQTDILTTKYSQIKITCRTHSNIDIHTELVIQLRQILNYNSQFKFSAMDLWKNKVYSSEYKMYLIGQCKTPNLANTNLFFIEKITTEYGRTNNVKFHMLAPSGKLYVNSRVIHDDWLIKLRAIDQANPVNQATTMVTLRSNQRTRPNDTLKIISYSTVMLPYSILKYEVLTKLLIDYRESDLKQLNFTLIRRTNRYLTIDSKSGELKFETSLATSHEPLVVKDRFIEFSVVIGEVMTMSHQKESQISMIYNGTLIYDDQHEHGLNFQKNEYIVKVSENSNRPGFCLLKVSAIYPGNPSIDGKLEYRITRVYKTEIINTTVVEHDIPSYLGLIDLKSVTGELVVGRNGIDREVIGKTGQLIIELVAIHRRLTENKELSNTKVNIRKTEVVVNIDDDNDNTPSFTQETYFFTIPENTTDKLKIYLGQVLAHDLDIISTVRYSFKKDQYKDLFVLDSETGELYTRGIPFDYETKKLYQIPIEASDGELTSSCNIVITIQDVLDNEAINLCARSQDGNHAVTIHVSESLPNNTIVTSVLHNILPHNLILTDASVRYRFDEISRFNYHGDSRRSMFSLDSNTGLLRTKVKLDYEKIPLHVLIIEISQNKIHQSNNDFGCTSTVTMTISVIDANDNIPSFKKTSITKLSINELSPEGTSIPMNNPCRDDDSDDELKLQILTPNSNLFTINPWSASLITLGKLDYETQQSHAITIICYDKMLHTSSAIIQVQVTDENDEQPVIHNPHTIFGRNFHIICTDSDISPSFSVLQYNAISTNPDVYVNVDKMSGSVNLRTDNSIINETKIDLECSDGLYKTSKIVTVILLKLTYNKVTISQRHINLNFNDLPYQFKSPNLIWNYQSTSPFLEISRNSKSNSSYVTINRFFMWSKHDSIQGSLMLYDELGNAREEIILKVKMRNTRPFQYDEKCYKMLTSYFDQYRNEETRNFKIYLSNNDLQNRNKVFFTMRLFPNSQKLNDFIACDGYNIKTMHLSTGHEDFKINQYTGDVKLRKLPRSSVSRVTLKITTKLQIPVSNKATVRMRNIKLISRVTFIKQPTFNSSKRPFCRFSTFLINVSSSIDDISHKLFVIPEELTQLMLNISTFLLPATHTSKIRHLNYRVSNKGDLLIMAPVNMEDSSVSFVIKVDWTMRNGSFMEFDTLYCPVILYRPSRVDNKKCSLKLIDGVRRHSNLVFYVPSRNNISTVLFSIPLTTTKHNCQHLSKSKGSISFFMYHALFSINQYTGQVFARTTAPNYSSHFKLNITINIKIGNHRVSMKLPVVVLVRNDRLIPPYALIDYFQNDRRDFLPLSAYLFNNSIIGTGVTVHPVKGHLLYTNTFSIRTSRIHLVIKHGNTLTTRNVSNYSAFQEKSFCSCGNSDTSFIISRHITLASVYQRNILITEAGLIKHGRTCSNINQPFFVSPSNQLMLSTYEMLKNKRDLELRLSDFCRVLVTFSLSSLSTENKHMPRSLQSFYQSRIRENLPIGSVVPEVRVKVIDEDKGQRIMLKLLGDNCNHFTISDDGVVRTARVLDREKISNYALSVVAHDGKNSIKIGMKILVLDDNDNAPQFTNKWSSNNVTILVPTTRKCLKVGDSNRMYLDTVTALDRDQAGSLNSAFKYSIKAVKPASSILVNNLVTIHPTKGTLSLNCNLLSWQPINNSIVVSIAITDSSLIKQLSNHITVKLYFMEKAANEQTLRVAIKPINNNGIVSTVNSVRRPIITVLNSFGTGMKIATVFAEGIDEGFQKNFLLDYELIPLNSTFPFSIQPSHSNQSKIVISNSLKRHTSGNPPDVIYQAILRVCKINRSKPNNQYTQLCSVQMTVTFIVTVFNEYGPQIQADPSYHISISEDSKPGTQLSTLIIQDRDKGVSGQFFVMLKCADYLYKLPLFELVEISPNKYNLSISQSAPTPLPILKNEPVTITAMDYGSPTNQETYKLRVTIIDVNNNAPYFPFSEYTYSIRSPLPFKLVLPAFIDYDSVSINRYNQYKVTGDLSISSQNKTHAWLIIPVNKCYPISFKLDVVASSGNYTHPKFHHHTSTRIFINCTSVLALLDSVKCPYPHQTNENILSLSPTHQLFYPLHNIHLLPTNSLQLQRSNSSMPAIVHIVIPHSFTITVCFVKFQTKLCNKRPIVITNIPFYFPTHKLGRIKVKFPLKLIGFSKINLERKLLLSQTGITKFKFQVFPVNHFYCKEEVELSLQYHNNTTNRKFNFPVPENARRGFVVSKWQFPNSKLTLLPSILGVNQEGLINIQINRVAMRKHGNIKYLHVIPQFVESQLEKQQINIILLTPPNIHLKLTPPHFACTLRNFNIPMDLLLTIDCSLYFLKPIQSGSTISVTFRNKLLTNATTLIHKTYHFVMLDHSKQTRNRYLMLNKPHNNNHRIIDKILKINPRVSMAMITINQSDYIVWLLPDNFPISRFSGINFKELSEVLCDNNEDCSNNGECGITVNQDYNEPAIVAPVNSTSSLVLPRMKVIKNCSCNHGYLGDKCQYRDYCLHKKICHNGGRCVTKATQFKKHNSTVCLCAKGYTGLSCYDSVDSCQDKLTCGRHGHCSSSQLGNQGDLCQCDVAWSGSVYHLGNSLPQCSIPLNHCKSISACYNRGTLQCIPRFSRKICVCKFGYYGDKCQYSSIGFLTDSFLKYSLTTMSNSLKLSLEFATLCHDCPLVTIEMSDYQLTLSIRLRAGKVTMQMNDKYQLNPADSRFYKAVTINNSAEWHRVTLHIVNKNTPFTTSIFTFKMELAKCGELDECDGRMLMFHGPDKTDKIQSISYPVTKTWFKRFVTKITVGKSDNISRGFVGCVRNFRFGSSSSTMSRLMVTKTPMTDNMLDSIRWSEESRSNLLFNGCPRYTYESLSQPRKDPCHISRLKCSGKCVDEWFWSYCDCRAGYEGPTCTAGFQGYYVPRHSMVMIMLRPEDDIMKRLKRDSEYITRSMSDQIMSVSMRIRTTEPNALLMLTRSSNLDFSILQIKQGHIYWLDSYRGKRQKLVHEGLIVNDNHVHVIMVTVDMSGSGRVILTVDNIQAIVELPKPFHRFINKKSPVPLYFFGAPNYVINSLGIKTADSYFGCVANLQIFNQSVPLLPGLSRYFNTTNYPQGTPDKGLSAGCPSRGCDRLGLVNHKYGDMQGNVCGRFQRCVEVKDTPNAVWGQIYCQENHIERLLAILIPIVITLILSVILVTLLCRLIRSRSQKLKKIKSDSNSSKMYPVATGNSVATSFMNNNNKQELPLIAVSQNTIKRSNSQDKHLKMDLIQKRNGTPRSITSSTLLMQELDRPDLIHDLRGIPHQHNRHNNSSGGGNTSSTPGNQCQSSQMPLIYHCAHPDEYEAVGSFVMSSSCSNSDFGPLNNTNSSNPNPNINNNSYHTLATTPAPSQPMPSHHSDPPPQFTPSISMTTIPTAYNYSTQFIHNYSPHTVVHPKQSIPPFSFYPPPPPHHQKLVPMVTSHNHPFPRPINTKPPIFTPSASASSSSNRSSTELDDNGNHNKHKELHKKPSKRRNRSYKTNSNNNRRNKNEEAWLKIRSVLPPPPPLPQQPIHSVGIDSTTVQVGPLSSSSVGSNSLMSNNTADQQYDYADSNTVIT